MKSVHDRIANNASRLKRLEGTIDDLQAERRAFIRDSDDDPVEFDDKIMRAKQARQACADRVDQLRDLAVTEPTRQWPNNLPDASARLVSAQMRKAEYDARIQANPRIHYPEMSAEDIAIYEGLISEIRVLEKQLIPRLKQLESNLDAVA